MLNRLLFAATLAGLFALPAVADAHHGGSGIVGTTRIGDLKMRVSTQADVRTFAGNPDIVKDEFPYEWVVSWGYHCRERFECRTYYEFNRDTDRLLGFVTRSKRFRTRRGTRVGDTRKRAVRNERRKADYNVCGGGNRVILRVHDHHAQYIFFNRRRVSQIIVDSTFVDC
jgi:hypothetical protein